MNRSKRLAVMMGMAVIFLLTGSAVARPLYTIGFDSFPDGTSVPAGIEITDQYASWGVTFHSFNPFGAFQATDVIDSLPTSSAPNFLAPGGPPPYCGGTLILQFLAPVSEVGSIVIDDQIPVAITAYGVGGSIVGSTSSNGNPTGLEAWSIAYPAGIARVEMAGGYLDYARPDGWGIDDLFYTPIPEPCTIILLGAGGVAFETGRSRRSGRRTGTSLIRG